MKEIVAKDGKKYQRISRWITVQHNNNPNKRNSLWDYVMDGYGYHPYNDKFNPELGLYLDWFRHDGKTYSLEQFWVLGNIWCGGHPIMYDDENGKLGVIGTVYMDGPIFGPELYGEWDEYCEHVRLYEEVK